MPHGYTCGRCETFVERGLNRSEMHGSNTVEHVSVHPPSEVDDSFALNNYTLCKDCRDALIEWVEGGPAEGSHTHDFNGIPVIPSVGLTDVAGINYATAGRLRRAGYPGKTHLKKASVSELADVDGIGNALAARIKSDVGDYKTATDIVKEIEYIVESYEGDE